ncbi:hypothetical protein VTI74DRAFT_969 [Chaetomium olivicolor]
MAHPVESKAPDQPDGPNYKAKLDKAATRVKSPPQEEQGTGIIDKVSQYVPAVGRMLGKQEEEPEPSLPEKKPPGPPERPHHDTQIEEFIKDQHRSKKIVGMEKPTQ